MNDISIHIFIFFSYYHSVSVEMVYVVLSMLINVSFHSGIYRAKILRVVNLFVHKNIFLL